MSLATASKILRWGILGTGNIARQFAQGLNAVPSRHAVLAVGSRQADTATAFAKTHSIATAYSSYAEVLADRKVDAVYISLPNSLHHPWTLAALAAGKHVLCEKPIANDAAQAQEMFDAAQRAGLVLAEAFMYRSHPLTHAVQAAVAAGKIGELKIIRTSFLYATNKIADNIRFNTSLGGGSLMDIGCYCLSFSRFFAGAEPTSMHVSAHMHSTGVDDYAVGLLHFPGDILATFTCGMAVRADNTASLLGTNGYIEIPIPWKPPANNAAFTIVDANNARDTQIVAVDTELYAMEADDLAASIFNHTPPRVSREETLGNMRALDEARRQIGLTFG